MRAPILNLAADCGRRRRKPRASSDAGTGAADGGDLPEERSSSASRSSRTRASSAEERRGSCRSKLKAEIAALGQDRTKLNQQLIDIAAQVRGVETKIGDAEQRLTAARRPRAGDPQLR